jgi:hypothetical protein
MSIHKRTSGTALVNSEHPVKIRIGISNHSPKPAWERIEVAATCPAAMRPIALGAADGTGQGPPLFHRAEVHLSGLILVARIYSPCLARMVPPRLLSGPSASGVAVGIYLRHAGDDRRPANSRCRERRLSNGIDHFSNRPMYSPRRGSGYHFVAIYAIAAE